MTEEKVKKRGWIKNVAIIFLSVLLVLTFFSNTFMNRSLPEVAVQYVQNGTVQAQIRGTGTITPTESYEVKSTQSRGVRSVAVQVGDEVKVGDVLLYYAEGKSEDIKAAEEALDAEMLSYQQALINSSTGQYSEPKRAIELARTALDEAKADRDKANFKQEDLDAANETLRKAQNDVAIYQTQYDVAAENFNALGGKREPSYSGGSTAAEKAALDKAKNNLAAKMLVHKTDYEKFKAAAKNEYKDSGEAVAMKALSEKYFKDYVIIDALGNETAKDEASKEYFNQYIAYKEVSKAQDEVDSAQAAYNQAVGNQTYDPGNVAEYNRLKKIKDDAQSVLNLANERLTAAKDKQEELAALKETYTAALTKVKECEKTLQDAMFSFEKTAALDNLNLGAQKDKITDLQSALNELRSGEGQGATVTSQVNGIVSAVNISAGNTAEADAALMTIEVPDMGYSVSFSVTTEQSKRVRVGDAATIMYNWGNDISATLAGIRSDPQNPSTNKMLVFKLTGEGVQSGNQLTLSVGEKGQNYDTVVPNSAIRTDSNGDFVLAVMTKNTGLGTRYIATRVDVQVGAKDDVNSGVTGGLVPGDYVITNSSKPIEPGMQVRLPD